MGKKLFLSMVRPCSRPTVARPGGQTVRPKRRVMRNRDDRVLMSLQRDVHAGRSGVPELHGTVLGPGDEPAVIRAERHRQHKVLVSRQRQAALRRRLRRY